MGFNIYLPEEYALEQKQRERISQRIVDRIIAGSLLPLELTFGYAQTGKIAWVVGALGVGIASSVDALRLSRKLAPENQSTVVEK